VVLECIVQSSPKSVNYWTKEQTRGEQIHVLILLASTLTDGNPGKFTEDVPVNSGGRYQTREEEINVYTRRILLTIEVR
jgi:hypothetical protein